MMYGSVMGLLTIVFVVGDKGKCEMENLARVTGHMLWLCILDHV